MKTPMQELIDKLNNVKPERFCSIETIKGWAESLLEKEKEIITDANDEAEDDSWTVEVFEDSSVRFNSETLVKFMNVMKEVLNESNS